MASVVVSSYQHHLPESSYRKADMNLRCVASALLLRPDLGSKWTPEFVAKLQAVADGVDPGEDEDMILFAAHSQLAEYSLLLHALDGVNRNKLKRLIRWASEKKRRETKDES